ncbi:MAG TPA: hypothetical protein VNN77_01275 [candidate division Zixibacteria bacterium]|nr:hypothetical protein [candidate division Zixibacteria bacterium]
MELHITAVRNDGLIIELDDGSSWDVSVGDNTKSICWYPTMRVIIAETGLSPYPFTLTNLDTAGPDVVQARRREKGHA